MEKMIEAKVIKIIDDYEIVINKGSEDGIFGTQKFLVYNLGDELFDPDTKEKLGRLEMICGKAEVKHIQPKMTTLISDDYEYNKSTKTIKRGGGLANMFSDSSTEEINQPTKRQLRFENIETGSLVKRIS